MKNTKVKKEKVSTEVELILLALNNYINKHNGNCVINLSVFAFDEDSNVFDDRLLAFGPKEVLLTDMQETYKSTIKDKRKFIKG
jgi:hypothetical protein